MLAADSITKVGEEASRSILEYGVLGALVILLAIALFLAIRALLKAKDDHLADKDRAKTAAMEQAAEAVALANETNRVAEALVDENSRSHESLDRKIDALATATPGINQAEYLKASRSR